MLLPSLVGASLAVGNHTVLALKPLCTFDAVEKPQTGEILSCFGALVLLEVSGRPEICRNLIQVSACRS
jgi:hypothetical protein